MLESAFHPMLIEKHLQGFSYFSRISTISILLHYIPSDSMTEKVPG